MKVALFADNAVGLEIARFLVTQYPLDVSIIFTTGKNKISELACENKIQTCVFESMQNALARMPDGVELGILAWWPKIIASPLLDRPCKGFLNTHPSWLPYNRGKHYNFWALVEQAPFGVTLHLVDAGVDSGPIVAQRKVPYDWTDNGETLYRKAQTAMVELFSDTYPKLRDGRIQSAPQELNKGSYHHSSELDAASCVELDKEYRARDLLNLLRARTFEGYPGCWFEDGGERYEISINIRKV